MRGRRGGIIGTFEELRKGFWWIGEVANYRAWPPGRIQAPPGVGAGLKVHQPQHVRFMKLKIDGGTVQ
jgi:hypothetical protein